jgi:hypothetical protein
VTGNYYGFFFHWHYCPSGPRPTSMKLSVSLRFFLNHRQSVGLLGRVSSSSQGLYLYTNTGKCTYTNTKHPCPERDSIPRSRLPNDTCLYATDRKEGVIVRKLQRGLSSMETWCERITALSKMAIKFICTLSLGIT